MDTYKFYGGGQAQAASFQELAEIMRNTSFSPGENLEEFMQETAERCRIQRGSDIRTDTVNNFIIDLLAHDFIEKV